MALTNPRSIVTDIVVSVQSILVRAEEVPRVSRDPRATPRIGLALCPQTLIFVVLAGILLRQLAIPPMITKDYHAVGHCRWQQLTQQSSTVIAVSTPA